jgi:hypothetical protein
LQTAGGEDMKTTVVAILLCMFSLWIYPDRSGAGWIAIDNSVFFDPSNIEYTDHGTILVWFNETLDRSEIIDRLIQHHNYYDKYFNYSDYSYSIEQFEFDCIDKFMRLTVEYDYDKYNRVIFRFYDVQSRFGFVAIRPENEKRFNEVCDFAMKNDNRHGLYQQHHHPLPQVLNPKTDKK